MTKVRPTSGFLSDVCREACRIEAGDCQAYAVDGDRASDEGISRDIARFYLHHSAAAFPLPRALDVADLLHYAAKHGEHGVQ